MGRSGSLLPRSGRVDGFVDGFVPGRYPMLGLVDGFVLGLEGSLLVGFEGDFGTEGLVVGFDGDFGTDGRVDGFGAGFFEGSRPLEGFEMLGFEEGVGR